MRPGLAGFLRTPSGVPLGPGYAREDSVSARLEADPAKYEVPGDPEHLGDAGDRVRRNVRTKPPFQVPNVARLKAREPVQLPRGQTT